MKVPTSYMNVCSRDGNRITNGAYKKFCLPKFRCDNNVRYPIYNMFVFIYEYSIKLGVKRHLVYNFVNFCFIYLVLFFAFVVFTCSLTIYIRKCPDFSFSYFLHSVMVYFKTAKKVAYFVHYHSTLYTLCIVILKNVSKNIVFLLCV